MFGRIVLWVFVAAFVAALMGGLARLRYSDVPRGRVTSGVGPVVFIAKEKYPFCRSKADLDSLTEFVDRGNQEKVNEIFKARSCVMLKKGSEVKIEESSEKGWLRVKLADSGATYYTVKGAVYAADSATQ